jgi:hypothetical protein
MSNISAFSVMVVLGTTIHEFACGQSGLAHGNLWMVGPSPTMTGGDTV